MATIGKKKKTLYNVVSNLANFVASSLISFLMVRIILLRMGSDYNGLNSVVTQFVYILTIFESSFTNASQVALYKPLGQNNQSKIDLICSTTSRAYRYIGVIMLIVGGIFAAIYSHFVKSSYDYTTILVVILLSIISNSVATFVAAKYRVLFQAHQTEYYVTTAQMLANILSQAAALVVILNTRNIIVLRSVYAIGSIVASIVVVILGKRKFRQISFGGKVDYGSIRGTFDVVVSVATGAVYMTAPSFYLASFSGTIYASVYAVYNSILVIVQNIIFSFLNAPRNGIGQIMAEGKNQDAKQISSEFEILAVLFSTIFLSTTYAVIIPFVLLFTQGVTDVEYANFPIALLLVVAQYIQFIHMPSGLIINVSGHFKAMKYIQLTAGALLIIVMFLGASIFGIYGILIANVLVGLLLAAMEIVYVRKKIITDLGYATMSKFLAVNVLFGAILAEIVRRLSVRLIASYSSFFLVGIFVLSSITVIILSLNYLLFKKDMKPIVGRVLSMISGK